MIYQLNKRNSTLKTRYATDPRRLRKVLNMPVKHVAMLAERSTSTIYRWERNKRKHHKLYKLYLGPLYHIVRGEENKL